MATELYLPPTFPYPITVVALEVSARDSVQRGTRLLTYSFIHRSNKPGTKPETRYGTWDSAVEGVIEGWKVRPGDVITERGFQDRSVLLVTEPCKHGVQIGGLCGLCGKDMTDYDYTGFSDAARASIQMTHSAFGPTVSLEEAQKIEMQTAERLLKARKLSLIVDLDQTIVHATVDPTVGEWIAEGEAWEARHSGKPPDDSDDSDSSSSSSESEGECNPNWGALKDVKKFRLGPESFGQPPPSVRGQGKGKGKGKLIENEGCMYYIKPRPGWKDFLRHTAEKYEMHVYTMGTRAYAEEVCSAIDPDGKIFTGRILSRDESGSLTQKSLQRLFPCDTSMVVIIDDRADVWEWSPNLIKVIPYDFFVGIGDINSTFLPKIDPLSTPTLSPGPLPLSPQPGMADDTTTKIQPNAEPRSSPEEADQAKMAKDAMLTQNSLALEAQLEERPLAKKQEELQGTSTSSGEQQNDKPPETGNVPSSAPKSKEPSSVSKPEKVPRKALLKNDDTELQRISKLLDEVHKRFFTAYDNRLIEKPKRRLSISRLRDWPKVLYDVTAIIPRMRAETLNGVRILFSSVIPLDMRPESTEIWRMANLFGARCSTELTSGITHVVAEKRGTVKVDAARRRGGITIVRLAWLMDSISLWRRQDETPYLLDDPRPTTSGTIPEPNVIYADVEPESQDWEMNRKDIGEGSSSLQLGEIDWNEINNEVDAVMNESDDEEEDGVRSARSGNLSEDDWTDETNSMISSANSTPRMSRKRLRSVTPSEAPVPINGETQDDSLRSPLAKRKKMAAERTGLSKLKEAISAEDLDKGPEAASNRREDESSSHDVTAGTEGDDENEGDEDAGDDEDDEDDFLARELEEEEWG